MTWPAYSLTSNPTAAPLAHSPTAPLDFFLDFLMNTPPSCFRVLLLHCPERSSSDVCLACSSLPQGSSQMSLISKAFPDQAILNNNNPHPALWQDSPFLLLCFISLHYNASLSRYLCAHYLTHTYTHTQGKLFEGVYLIQFCVPTHRAIPDT